MTTEVRLAAAFEALRGLNRYYDPSFPEERAPYTAFATLCASLNGRAEAGSEHGDLPDVRELISDLASYAVHHQRGALVAAFHALTALEVACDPPVGEDPRALVRHHLSLAERASRP